MNQTENYLHEFLRIFFANQRLIKRVFLFFAAITLLIPVLAKPTFDITAEVLVQSKKLPQMDPGGGALNTAGHARELKRPLMVAPGPMYSPSWAGSNAALRGGEHFARVAEVVRVEDGPETLHRLQVRGAEDIRHVIDLLEPDVAAADHQALATAESQAGDVERRLEHAAHAGLIADPPAVLADALLAGVAQGGHRGQE